MKNIKSFVILLAMLALGQMAWAQFGGGSGTEDDPYIIKSDYHWQVFANNIIGTNSEHYASAYYRLDADIRVEVMAGNYDRPFKGTFDGNGHYIDTWLGSSDGYSGPFNYIEGATIKNLTIHDGSFSCYNQYFGGLVGQIKGGNNTILNCHVDNKTDIYLYYNGNGFTGGFVGIIKSGSTTTIKGCLFEGNLKSKNENYRQCAGFVGYKEDYSNFTMEDCLFNPNQYETTVNPEGSATFIINQAGPCYLQNTYYSWNLGYIQGTKAYVINHSEGITFSGDNVVTACVRTMASEGAVVTIDAVEGYTYVVTTSDNTSIPIINNQFTMPASDVTVTKTAADYAIGVSGTEDDPYIIYTTGQLDLLASRVGSGTSYSGKYFKMGADITVNNMIGDNSHQFSGTFDGNGHILTFNRNTTEQYCEIEIGRASCRERV